MNLPNYTPKTLLAAAFLTWLVFFCLVILFGSLVLTDPKLFSLQSSIDHLYMAIAVVSLLLPKRFATALLFLSGPVTIFFPLIGFSLAASSFLKRLAVTKWLTVILCSVIFLLMAPFVFMDFANPSLIRLEKSEKIGNKTVAVYGYHAIKNTKDSSSLCIETPILPGLNLSKEIYSEFGDAQIEFRKVDDQHIEFDTSRRTTRTVAI